ncbi:TonB-dependent receptor plug domain-containing protein [Undibacterium squillarum]|uniref:TonB-dependent receptor plug domain-containing protein n=1 Tax=Undibacterium squillarum TaxID=1131567 RepID=UPI0035AF6CA4
MNKLPQLKKMSLAIALCIGASPAVFAQTADNTDKDAKKDAPQRVVVTGSNIKRIDVETAAPLQVISRKEIQQSGAITAKDILELTTSNDRSALSDLGGSNSWASGSSGASLRNLGVNSTLVLINGRRLPNYGFADGTKDTFVNIDSIPASAVDRVEILRDGASAIYGSAAIGGVINIITRKNVTGVEIGGNFSGSTEETKFNRNQTASVTAGTGDFAKDGYNAYISMDVFRRNSYSLDYANRRLPGWYKTLNKFNDPNVPGNYLSSYSWPGNYYGRYPANYADPKLAGKLINTPAPGCAADKLVDGLCRFNGNENVDQMPGADRVLIHSQGTLRINENLTAWAEIQLANVKSTYHTSIARLNSGAASSWYDSIKGEMQYYTDPSLPTGHAYNPYSFPIGMQYRFADNPDMFKNVGGSQQYRVVTGLQGSNFGWEWDASVGTMLNRAHQRQQLYKDRYAFADAITSGEYKFGQKNSQALLDRMFPIMGSDGKSTESWIDLKANRELMELGGGPLTLVLGGDIRRESLLHKSMDNILAARIVGFSGVSISGSRNVYAAFAELDTPVSKRLNLNFALRADKSGPTATEFIPKSSASFNVNDRVKLRASASRGYRAPSLPETGNGGVSWFTSGDDPKRCADADAIYEALQKGNATDKQNAETAYYSGCNVGFPVAITPNKALQPERSAVYGLGVVLQPTKTMSVTFDWWSVHRRNEISTFDNDYILNREDSIPGQVIRDTISDKDKELAARASELAGKPLSFKSGKILGIRNMYVNMGQTKVSGLDFSVKDSWNLGEYGKLNAGLEGTYMLNMQWFDIDKGQLDDGQVGYRNYPRLTSNFMLNWSKGPWSVSSRTRFVSATRMAFSTYDSTNYQQYCDKLGASGEGCKKSYDIVTGVGMSYTGFKNAEIGLDIGNVFNRPDPVLYTLGSSLPLRGRTFNVWGRYKF